MAHPLDDDSDNDGVSGGNDVSEHGTDPLRPRWDHDG